MPEASSSLNPLDLKHEHKRVRSVVKTPEGRQAIRDVLGLNIVFSEFGEQAPPGIAEAQAHQRDLNREEQPRVVTLMPSHHAPKPETTDAFFRMTQYSRDLCRLDAEPSVASSVVHWVRNELLLRLAQSRKEFDYVLFMDDDIVPPHDALIRLLNHKVDIVAGACTVRQDPPLPNFRTFDRDNWMFRTAFEWTADGLMEVGGVGTGFVLISHKALDDIGEYWLSCRYEVEHFGMHSDTASSLATIRREWARKTDNKMWFQFLPSPLGEGEFGEDLSFCLKARECGYKVHVDTSVRCGHIGSYAYSLDDYMFYQQGMLAKQKIRAELDTPLIAPQMPEVVTA
jgi:hypothetical protein